MERIKYVNTNTGKPIAIKWVELPTTYRLHSITLKDEDGSFYVLALNLPGIASIGDTAKEALANFRKVAVEVLQCYTSSNTPIPWKANYIIPEGADHKWLSVSIQNTRKSQ